MTPKLRFPKFSGEWEAKKLGDLCKLRAGKFVSAAEIYPQNNRGLYPCFGGNGLRGYVKDYNYKGIYPLIGRQGALCGNVTLGIGKFYATEHAVVANPYTQTDVNWLFYQLGRLDLNQYATGQAQPGLSVDVLNKVVSITPGLINEQQKIAGFLAVVDERVAAMSKKVELLEQYKKGIMQKIFSQKLRFKDENESDYPDWQEKKLGDIGKTFTGLTGKSGEDFGEGKPYITYMQIFGNSKIEGDFGKVRILPNEKQSLVLKGDIFFTTSSETALETGYTSTLLEDYGELYLNSFCFGYRPNLLHIIPNFARYQFHSHGTRKKIARLAQGSTRYNISKNEVMKLALSLPSVKEQQKIANFLTSLDDKINLEKAKLEQAKLFKKSLLQRMFV